MRMAGYPLKTVACALALAARCAGAQEVPSVSGWQTGLPTPGTHRACADLGGARSGKGCGKIVGTSSEKGARGCFNQEFQGKAALPASRPGMSMKMLAEDARAAVRPSECHAAANATMSAIESSAPTS